MRFPFLDGGAPRSTSYGVYISQLTRFALAPSHVDDFTTRIKVLTAKHLKEGFINFFRPFQNFIDGILT